MRQDIGNCKSGRLKYRVGKRRIANYYRTLRIRQKQTKGNV